MQIPTAFVAGLTVKGECSEYYLSSGEEYFFSFATASLYCIPLAIIVFCYIRMGQKILSAGPRSSTRRRRRRSVNSILFVIVLYALCWAPVHAVHLWMAVDPEVTAKDVLYVELHTAANVLLFINSSVNPFVYTLVGPPFRRHMKRIAISIVKCRFTTSKEMTNNERSFRSGYESSGHSDQSQSNMNPRSLFSISKKEPRMKCSSTWL